MPPDLGQLPSESARLFACPSAHQEFPPPDVAFGLHLSLQTALWIKREGGVKSIEVLKEDTVGDVAEVTMKITRGAGDSSVVHYKLIWENSDWKIDGVASDPTSPAPTATSSVEFGEPTFLPRDATQLVKDLAR